MTFRGSGVSEAARPTSSVPAKEKAAVTKTEQTPLKPLAKAPGLCERSALARSKFDMAADAPLPVSTADVLVVNAACRAAATVEDDGSEDENDDDQQLEAGRPELFFSVAKGAEDIDEDDQEPEDGDPCLCECELGSLEREAKCAPLSARHQSSTAQ